MKKIFVLLVLSVASLCAVAQSSDPVVFEINGKPYYKSQFMKDFYQSIGKDPAAAPTACTYEKRKALEEYVQLYVNFQAKITDAYAMGLDTVSSLKKELATYRKELAAPYLIDSATLQTLLREAYDRHHYVLHAAHLLVPCIESASPEDTLKAYKHAMQRYEEALKASDFYTVAQAEMKEQRSNDRDPLVREKANEINPMEGDLGCFSVFDMIYSFESAAYNMQPGEVSKPVRSRYGYHIIKLFDRYKYYGKAQLAHIWVSENDPNAKGKINMAYRQLQEGTDFGVVAKDYSDDRTTSTNGGIMPELLHNQLPYAYVEQVSKGLKVNEYTQPFQTRFGWHIIKLLKQETMPEFESMIPYYRSRMTRGERANKPQHIFVEQCKKQYNFVDYTQQVVSKKGKGKNAKITYAASLDNIRKIVTDSVFSAIFNYDSNEITDMRPLFKIGNREFNSRQFARHMYKHKTVHQLCNLDIFVRDRYKEFVDDMVLQYADDHLEEDNAEFGNLINEYRHGLMIFSYNDQMVWSKAVKDSLGFEEFYQKASLTHNYNDTNDAVYFWNERARTNVFTITDSTILNRKSIEKIIKKATQKGWSSNDLRNQLAAKCGKKIDGSSIVSNQLMFFEQGNQNVLSANEWRAGSYIHVSDSGFKVYMVEKILAPELKTREEARGFYLNDYQNYLEEQNNAALRKKYNIVIHQDVVDEITY